MRKLTSTLKKKSRKKVQAGNELSNILPRSLQMRKSHHHHYYFYYNFITVDPFATNLGLMVHHHKLEYLVESWIAVFKVKVTAKDKNVNKLLFR